jgi:Zn finger protein HypA/HybF involved in hydrogenase expression
MAKVRCPDCRTELDVGPFQLTCPECDGLLMYGTRIES